MRPELRRISFFLLAAAAIRYQPSVAFSPVSRARAPLARTRPCNILDRRCRGALSDPPKCNALLLSAKSDEADEEANTSPLSESDQLLLGIVGCMASALTLYSEAVLRTTGCGLPAGPYGLIGLAEGISYLGVFALAAYALFTKIRTDSGLPAGPGGILGAAEGLSFLALYAGLIVLGLQVMNYGYIPNAVPMEGGMCQ